MNEDNNQGANKKVLIIGGGVSGMEAALNLAEFGAQVYLVESSPTIGGLMARLNKTFPTNDCAICILAPKFVSKRLKCTMSREIRILLY